MEDVIIIGAGQAGLGVSYFLKRAGIRHIVLERSRIGESWRSQRWDSFSFNTPNALTVMPGCTYAGAEPNGFMSHQTFVDILETFARDQGLPVVGQTPALSLSCPDNSGPYEIRTPERTIIARSVVIASGSQNCPKVPALARSLPGEVAQMHASAYRAPSKLPAGAVLVVGSGSSGGQIAEDLIEAGRTVLLATSRVPSFPRRYRGRDIVAWFDETGRLAQRLTALHPSGALTPQPLLSGVRGGHTLSLRTLRHRGAILLGRLISVDGSRLMFDASLWDNLSFGDAMFAEAKQNIDAYISSHGLKAPAAEPDPGEVHSTNDDDEPGVRMVDIVSAGISTVIWCTGFRTDFGWMHIPIFDVENNPRHLRGVTGCKGAFITGLQWLSTRRSGLVAGVEDDAQYIASHIAQSLS